MTGSTAGVPDNDEIMLKAACKKIVENEEDTLNLANRILDSLGSGESPPRPSTVYSRLIIILGPLGWLVVKALSKSPGAAATLLDAFETACIEEGADPGVMLKLRDIVARYYDRLHPVMKEIPPVLTAFQVYPNKNFNAIHITLYLDNEDRIDFVATRDDAKQLADTIKWALEALEMDGSPTDEGTGEEDDRARPETPPVVKLDELQAAISTVFEEGGNRTLAAKTATYS